MACCGARSRAHTHQVPLQQQKVCIASSTRAWMSEVASRSARWPDGPTNDAGTVMVLRPKPGTPEREKVIGRMEDAQLHYSTTSSWDIDVGSLWVNPVYVASWKQSRVSSLPLRQGARADCASVFARPWFGMPCGRSCPLQRQLMLLATPGSSVRSHHRPERHGVQKNVDVPDSGGVFRAASERNCPASSLGRMASTASRRSWCPSFSRYRAGKFRETDEMMEMLVELRKVLVERMLPTVRVEKKKAKRLLIYPHLKAPGRSDGWTQTSSARASLR